jgi:hypothetical protein
MRVIQGVAVADELVRAIRALELFAMRAAVVYFQAELRVPYLPEVYGPSFGVSSSEPRPTAPAPVYLNDEEEDQRGTGEARRRARDP